MPVVYARLNISDIDFRFLQRTFLRKSKGLKGILYKYFSMLDGAYGTGLSELFIKARLSN